MGINSFYSVLCFLIFDNKPLLQYALANLVTKEKLKEALQSLYTYDSTNVDDELVQSFYQPTQVPSVEATVEVLSQIYVNDPGKTPMNYHQLYPHIVGGTVCDDNV